MAHTYCSSLFHCVFSTEERRKIIPEELQERLWAGLHASTMKALAVGGIEDHVHILLSLPSSKAIANAMREIKSGSSHWMRAACAMPAFEWQEGYGAFSIGQTQIASTVAYVARQKEHHKKRDFQAEFVAFLKKHRIEYDARYVWG